MFQRGETGHEIEDDAEAPSASVHDELLHIVEGAVAGSYAVVIGYVVSGVVERGSVTGADQEGVAAEGFYIVQLLNDAAEVADSVIVGVVETWKEYLIENALFEPGRLQSHRILSFGYLCLVSAARSLRVRIYSVKDYSMGVFLEGIPTQRYRDNRCVETQQLVSYSEVSPLGVMLIRNSESPSR
jgi:hypothetical protein